MINCFIKKIANSLRWRIERIFVTVCKFFNTFYYRYNKNNILVVNASFFQFFSHVRTFNLGDDLNYHLIKALSGKKVVAYNQFYHGVQTNYMCIGSVIDWLADEKTIVWGSGILNLRTESENNKVNCLSKDSIRAVRGRKTRQILQDAGKDCPEIYGDPALLLPLVYHPSISIIAGRIGIIPHYKDLNNPNIRRLLESNERAILIDVKHYKDWHNVIDSIVSCEFIISSSLHGLILADAYGVPNQWIIVGNGLPGGAFKFEDYYSSVCKNGIPFKITNTTTMKELETMKQTYQSIDFNPLPLLRACPFLIQNQNILDLLARS